MLLYYRYYNRKYPLYAQPYNTIPLSLNHTLFAPRLIALLVANANLYS